ncbi:MAG: hypothetical protein KGI39_03540 [Patescibacteria group bacterium]|nr:hypothetical protein [Patescibacteria group bacterium]
MKKKEESGDRSFKRYSSENFGLGEVPPISDSDVRNILNHFNGGFKFNYVRDDDCTNIERMQSNFL